MGEEFPISDFTVCKYEAALYVVRSRRVAGCRRASESAEHLPADAAQFSVDSCKRRLLGESAGFKGLHQNMRLFPGMSICLFR